MPQPTYVLLLTISIPLCPQFALLRDSMPCHKAQTTSNCFLGHWNESTVNLSPSEDLWDVLEQEFRILMCSQQMEPKSLGNVSSNLLNSCKKKKKKFNLREKGWVQPSLAFLVSGKCISCMDFMGYVKVDLKWARPNEILFSVSTKKFNYTLNP